jgi:hypothetical protein
MIWGLPMMCTNWAHVVDEQIYACVWACPPWASDFEFFNRVEINHFEFLSHSDLSIITLDAIYHFPRLAWIWYFEILDALNFTLATSLMVAIHSLSLVPHFSHLDLFITYPCHNWVKPCTIERKSFEMPLNLFILWLISNILAFANFHL